MPGTIAGAVLIAPFFPFSAFAGVPSAILPVERLPILGTGKVDYVGATAMAKERFGAADVAAA